MANALQIWLVLVACLRFLAVIIGIFNPNKFKTTMITGKPQLVTDLFGRLFAAWTIITCALCVTCASDPSNKGVYGVTLFSFSVALAFFLSETLIYKTVTWKGATSPFIVASVSVVWMAAGWSHYTA